MTTTTTTIWTVSPDHDFRGHAPYGETVQGHVSCLGEMEDVLVAIVEKAASPYRFVMPHGYVSPEAWVVTGVFLAYGDGLDPMDDVLEHKVSPHPLSDVPGNPGVGGDAANVQEKGAIVPQHSGQLFSYLPHPS